MGEKRESVACGKAQPITFFSYFFGIGSTAFGPEPNPAKFEDKWFGDEGPDDVQQLVLKAKEQFAEKYADQIEATGFQLDNVNQTKYMRNAGTMRQPRPQNGPVFSDFHQMGYNVSYDRAKYMSFLLNQLNHCIGNLGEDHPTCQKAAWYYMKGTTSPFATYLEEMGELGHWDTARVWGIKPRRSFLPFYQPVKQNIPGAYEFYRSKEYLDGYSPDLEGEHSYPFAFCE
eukprot:TRINITY_DN37577_c0_g1_i1.p1 TRINITY_DN37577_c0_g1~~TRINITY_DN37577_c0_g1_i1.p1  ORF type:complete len:251 (+),score=86.71 TRINITY_DN37577_c0_g1_i1:67-753(+)